MAEELYGSQAGWMKVGKWLVRFRREGRLGGRGSWKGEGAGRERGLEGSGGWKGEGAGGRRIMSEGFSIIIYHIDNLMVQISPKLGPNVKAYHDQLRCLFANIIC